MKVYAFAILITFVASGVIVVTVASWLDDHNAPYRNWGLTVNTSCVDQINPCKNIGAVIKLGCDEYQTNLNIGPGKSTEIPWLSYCKSREACANGHVELVAPKSDPKKTVTVCEGKAESVYLSVWN
jgi:hypothetical protein